MIISKTHANKRNPLDTLLSCLDKVQRIGQDRWKACCPSHDDMSPSLAIKNDEGCLLLHCFAGCETEDVEWRGHGGLVFRRTRAWSFTHSGP